MTTPLHCLIVEDSTDDARLLIHELRVGGFEVTSMRVDTPEALCAALERQPWDIVISDYRMPRFTGLDALAMVRATDRELPFILVSGTVGEETAVAAVKGGANDYLMKDRLGRLVPAVQRELRDAADRRAHAKAVADLRASEDRFRSFFESSNVGLSVTEPAGAATPNAAFCGMLGYSVEEFLLLTWQAVTHPDDVETTQRAIDALVAGTENEIRMTKRFLHKNGSVIWADLSSTLHHSATGQPSYLVSAIVDITERKQAEERLNQQNVMLNALINSPSDIAIFSLDRNYCYTTFNVNHRQQMQSIWGADIRIGTSLLECMTDSRLRDIARQSIDRALLGETFIEVQHQPGPDIYFEFIWNPIRQSEGGIEGVTVFIRDITERRLAEAALARQAAELRDRNDALSRFNQVAVGRELRMVELKRVVNEMCVKSGEPLRFHVRALGEPVPDRADADA